MKVINPHELEVPEGIRYNLASILAWGVNDTSSTVYKLSERKVYPSAITYRLVPLVLQTKPYTLIIYTDPYVYCEAPGCYIPKVSLITEFEQMGNKPAPHYDNRLMVISPQGQISWNIYVNSGPDWAENYRLVIHKHR